MRIHVKTKHLDEPADLVWGEYRNNGPTPEPALRLFSPGGEPLMTATRSLSQFDVFPMPGFIILHIDGANDGLLPCLVDQGVVEAPVVIVPIGEEQFAAVALTEKARADLAFAMMPAAGTIN